MELQLFDFFTQHITHFFESRFHFWINFWIFKIFESRFNFWIDSFKESNQKFWLNPEILKWILNLKSWKILNRTSSSKECRLPNDVPGLSSDRAHCRRPVVPLPCRSPTSLVCARGRSSQALCHEISVAQAGFATASLSISFHFLFSVAFMGYGCHKSKNCELPMLSKTNYPWIEYVILWVGKTQSRALLGPEQAQRDISGTQKLDVDLDSL